MAIADAMDGAPVGLTVLCYLAFVTTGDVAWAVFTLGFALPSIAKVVGRIAREMASCTASWRRA